MTDLQRIMGNVQSICQNYFPFLNVVGGAALPASSVLSPIQLAQ